jgi:lipopolysaccharide/colanic/teichoic acid biosynthesis glycosyltransferase
MARRALNLCLCIMLIPLALPLMVLISLLVCLDSPGPAMFSQERVGREGRRYRTYKFRTMRWNLDAPFRTAPMGASDVGGGAKMVHKSFHDLKVTRVGQVLRETRLEQLPQIFNVLKGDMSFVGPRPKLPPEMDACEAVRGSAERPARDHTVGGPYGC